MNQYEQVSIFVDESGDIGFSEKSLKRSPIFVIAFLVPTNISRLTIDLKRFLRNKLRVGVSELKFHNDSDETRRSVLQFLCEKCHFEAGYVAIDKRAVRNKEFRENPHLLYNYLAIHYVLGFVIRAFAPSKITYVIDRSMKKSMRIEFDKYAERKAAWLALHDSSMEIRAAFRVEDFKELPELIVRHEDSRKEPCLQVVDYLAGSVSRAFRGDHTYYQLISRKFREDWKVTWGLQKI
jgi:ribosomal protein L44E